MLAADLIFNYYSLLFLKLYFDTSSKILLIKILIFAA